MPTTPVEFALLFSTGVVAFALVLSGAGKIGRADSTLESMAALRVPPILHRRWVAAALPIWEIALGLSLLVLPGGYRASAAALALATFVVFTVFVVGVLRRGEEVDCGCFGVLSADDRVTRWTVLRNVLLIALAAVTALGSIGRPPFVIALGEHPLPLVLAVALAWALVAIAVLAVVVRTLRARLDAAVVSGAPPAEPGIVTATAAEGSPIPEVEVVDADGVTFSLRSLGAGNPVLLVFLSAECGKCAAVARRVPEWSRGVGPGVLTRVLTSSRPQVLRERMPEVVPHALFGAGEARRALGIVGNPSAVLLGGAQYPFVASPVAYREDEIDALVRGVVEAQAQGAR